jgi:REP element-mobilizing transposase RayT
VWGTKNRISYFNDLNTKDILGHILTNAFDQGIWMDHLNAYQDHFHCLISLNPDQALSTAIKLVKGESSYWINRNVHSDQKFRWAVEYYASSVSIKMLPTVRQYIQNQEIHHHNITWAQEERKYQAMITRLLSPFRQDR